MPESTLHENELSAAALNRALTGYRIVREVGHGSMGVVYEARQVGVERRVAIKVLPPNMALRERTVKRFLREAEAMGRLSHPNIVDIHEVGSIGSISYFSMKFVEGPPLDRVLKAGPLAIDDVLSIGIDVASALAHAHSRGVLHRDIKPSNLLRDGERVLLTDFGLARPLDQEEAGTMTESGDLVGTPLYMSPEQISGSGDAIDGRSDVWGLGATLYELLAQRPPFQGPNAQTILNAILSKDPPLLHKLRDDVPRDLEAVILKCLEKDVDRRYTTAAALLEDLRAVRDGRPVSARPPRFFDPAVRWMRRNPIEASVGIVLLAVAGVLVLVWQSSQRQVDTIESERDRIELERSELQKAMSLAAVRQELLNAYKLWQSGERDSKNEAFERITNLIEEFEDRYPEIVVEAIEICASFVHEVGVERERVFVSAIETKAQEESPERRLLWLGALYSGLERFDRALSCQIGRSQLVPRDPLPYLERARLHRRVGRQARAEANETRWREESVRALGLLQTALRLSIDTRSEELAVHTLLERARILLDLDRPDRALADIEVALARDRSRVEAGALKKAAQLRMSELDALARSASPMASTPESSAPLAGTPFELPVPKSAGEVLERTKTEMEQAGKGLRSIFRGFKDVLTAPADPADSRTTSDADQ